MADPIGTERESSTPSDAKEPAPLPTPTRDITGDVFLWRDKKLSLSLLGSSTALWVVLDYLGFSFLTVASWVGIATLTPLFIWANVAPFFGKEPPELFEWEVSAQTTLVKTNSVRERVEETCRWFAHRIIGRRDWALFVQIVAGLWATAWLSSKVDLLTLLYIGVLLGLTCPPVFVRYEDKIKERVNKTKEAGRRVYSRIDDAGKKVYNRVDEAGRRAYKGFDEKVMRRAATKDVPKDKKAD